MIVRALAMVLALCALTGCVSQIVAPASGLSAEEQQLYAAMDREPTTLTAVLDSDFVAVEFVPPAGWSTAIAGCMNAAGYSDYASSGELQLPAGDAGISYEQTLAFYLCHAKYPLVDDATNDLSLAQLDYLYVYYRDSLVPCLGAVGFPIFGEIPTKQQFVVISAGRRWHPYDLLPAEALAEVALLQSCPASPFADEAVQF